jgi:predicted nucleic acid-binding protein
VRAFFDTNVLVYAFLDDPRQVRARTLLREGGFISAQVLNEFTNVSRRKYCRPWKDIESAIAVIRAQFGSILALSADTHAAALALARDHGFNFYDALIVASAQEAGCDTLLTEDLQSDRKIGALTIRNPFLEMSN